MGLRLRDFPIRTKLIVMAMVTSLAALGVSSIALVIVDVASFRSALRSDLESTGSIIANNSTGALSFRNPADAGEVLGALRDRSNIRSACTYDESGQIFAAYSRKSERGSTCPSRPEPEKAGFTSDALIVYRPVILGDKRIGTIYIDSSMEGFWDNLRSQGIALAVVLGFAGLLSFLISSRLQRLISGPVLALANAADKVSETKDFSFRATKETEDEVGQLVDAFNRMLSQISQQNAQMAGLLESEQRAANRLAELNADLGNSNANLTRSNEALERFAFVASHDLQEPLRMITAYSQLLVKTHPGEFDKEAAMFVGNIVEGTKRMRELLADLLAYTEISAGPEGPAEAEAVDLNLVIENVRQNLKATIDENGAVITSDALPTLAAHKGHFVPLFQNLIGNAIKYRSEHPPRIHISVQKTDGQFRFAVADNGMGIDPEYHEKIFAMFKRLHGKKIPGTGIGLAICQRVVERYGGRIWVESQVGQGATFLFTLPTVAVYSAGATK